MPIQRDAPLQSTMPAITLTTGSTGDYTIQFPATNGTANQVLRNDGSGVLTFQALGAAAPVGFSSTANGELTAAGGSTNQSFAVVTRGTGSIQNIIPTNSTTGGAKPGNNTFKFQSASPSITGVSGNGYNVSIDGAGDNNYNSTAYQVNLAALGFYSISSDYGVVVADTKSAIGAYIKDSFIGPGFNNATTNETRYFSFFGPRNAAGVSSNTSGVNSGANPHLCLGGSNQYSGQGGFDCVLTNGVSICNRYAAFGCVTTNSTTQYMTPNGSVQTSVPAVDWGSIPRILNSAVSNKVWAAWGTIIAMKSGGTDYRIWRFYYQVDLNGIAGAATSVANSAGAAGWTVAASVNTNLGGMNFAVTGGLLDTIRWFGSAWVIESV